MTELQISVSGIGGIESFETTLEPGVTLIAGPNATNKTSLLRAIAFGIGVDDVPLKSDVEEARVELSLDGTERTRVARRDGTDVTIRGEGWLDGDADVATFRTAAALLEFNPLRVAVRQNGDIESALKDPLDIERLENRRAQLIERKRALQDQISDLDGVDQELDAKQEELSAARERKAELESRLERLRQRQAELDFDDAAQQLREERADVIAERDRLDDQIASTERAIDRLETRREELDDRIEELRGTVNEQNLDDLRDQYASKRDRLTTLETRLDVLQSVLTANREMVHSDFAGILGAEHGLMEDRLQCWTCGQSTTEAELETTVDELQTQIEQLQARKQEFEPALEELEAEIDAAEGTRAELDSLKSEFRDVTRQLEDRRETLATQRTRRSDLETRLEELDDEIASVASEQAQTEDEVGDEIENTRVQLQTVGREIERLEGVVEDLESKRERRSAKRSELGSLTAEITSITDHIETIEHDFRDEFNERMEEVLLVLDFEDIERVWLDGAFELVIAREVDGRVREDGIQHLAESEREVIGLVLGLAAYLAFGLQDDVPCLLLDSLGALDTARVDALLDYFRSHTDYLLPAVHPQVEETLDYPALLSRDAPPAD